MNRTRLTATALLLLAALPLLLATGCATAGRAPASLRIGYTPNYPPIAFSIDGQFAGIEADCARDLAAALGTTPEFRPLPWRDLIPALQSGDIDIIMSGLTITPARATKVSFCDSYIDNPLLALVRAGEAASFPDADAIQSAPVAIGVLRGTSGEIYARRHCPRARIIPLAFRTDAPIGLIAQQYKLYIDDFAANVDILLQSEAALELIPIPLAEQKLAWAVAPGNDDLRAACNAVLADWRSSGHLDAILDRWLTYRHALNP